jgi:hypothetical protein
MKRYFPLLAIGLLCGLLWLAISHYSSRSVPDGLANAEEAEARSDGSPQNPFAPDASGPALRPLGVGEHTPPDVVPPELREDKSLPRVQELQKMALEKRQRDEAAVNTHQARTEVQLRRHSAWVKLLQDNWAEFETLRQQAAQSPDKKVPCSICNGRSVLDLCVVCDHTGKCPTCGGSGKVLERVCSTCVGTGKCFLCSGSGKMPCPFCESPGTKEEGKITAHAPDPPADLPIN